MTIEKQILSNILYEKRRMWNILVLDLQKVIWDFQIRHIHLVFWRTSLIYGGITILDIVLN